MVAHSGSLPAGTQAAAALAASEKGLYVSFGQTNRIVSQRVETSLHVGTHLNGPMHAADGAGDIASLPLTKLVHEGVVGDVSDVVEDWSIITPKHITDRMEVKKGDILILHTGYHRYYEGKPQQDPTRYFCMHPGGTRDLAQWMHDTQIAWWGIDAGSGDHPMNTTIRYMRPDLTHRFEEKVGQSVREYFGEYEYRHHKSFCDNSSHPRGRLPGTGVGSKAGESHRRLPSQNIGPEFEVLRLELSTECQEHSLRARLS